MMKNKRLKLQLRRLFCVVMTFVFIISLSSCGSKNVTGGLDLDATYATLGNYSITNGELWDELKWDANDYINEKIEDAIVAEYYDQVVEVMEGADPDNLKADYTAELREIAIRNVYSFSENTSTSADTYQEKADDLEAKQKALLVNQFVDTLYINENVVIDPNDILVDDDYSAIYKFYYKDLAKKLFAKAQLLEDIADAEEDAADDDDEDTIGYFTKSQFVTQFTGNYRNTGDVDLLMIRFMNSDEVTTTLRSFGIKVYNKVWYYVYPSTEMSYAEYCKFYDDFTVSSSTKENYIPIDANYGKAAILSIYIEIYNYIYTYRDSLSNMDQNFVTSQTADRRQVTKNILDYFEAFDEDSQPTIESVFSYVANSEYTHYTADEINDINSSLKGYIYTTLSTDETDDDYTRYSTDGRSYGDYYFLIFKVEQDADQYTDIYDEDATTDENYESILANEELYTTLYDELVDDQITDNFISNKISDAMDDTSLKIFDKVMEIQYSSSDSEYSKTHSNAPNKNTLATIKYDGKKTYITVLPDDNSDEGMWNELEKENGTTVAVDLLAEKIIKDSDEYKNIDKETIEGFEDTIEYLLTSFANDSLSSYGYNSSIGKYNFMMLYYHTADMDEIIDDFYKVQYVYSDLINDYTDDSLLDFFLEYSTIAYNNYFSINDSRLLVYIDMDEDNTPDDTSTWTKEQISGAKDLLDEITNIVLASTDTHATALEAIVEEYNSSSRFKTGDELPTSENYDPTTPECRWADYRHLGLYIKIETDTMTNAVTNTDDAIKARLKEIYNMEGFRIEGTFPSQYIDSDIVDTWIWEGTDGSVTGNKYLKSEDGLNLIVVTSGTEPASAKFTVDDNDLDGLFVNIPIYYNEKVYTIADIYNSTDIINKNQMILFLYETLEDGTTNMTPSQISSALSTFFSEVLTRYQDDTSQREALLYYAYGKTNTTSISFANVDNDTRLTKILEINRRVADSYIEDDDLANNYANWWTKLLEVIAKENA